MVEPKYTVKNGIAYYEEPYQTNLLEFAYAHLDCDSIISKNKSEQDKSEVIAYATEEKYNIELYDVYEMQYKDLGYTVMRQISSLEVSCID